MPGSLKRTLGAWSGAGFTNHGLTCLAIGLIKVATMSSPARAATSITITLAEKIVSVAGLAADGKTLEKCHVAIASLVATSSASGFVCFGTLGIGCTAGVLAIAAEAVNWYGQCHGRP